MSKAIDFKRGDTFKAVGVAKLGGVVSDFTGWTITAQLRSATTKELIASLTGSWLNATIGSMQLVSSGSTASWLIGNAVLDVRFTSPSAERTTTSTANVNIQEPVTI